jgi:hypothetical protein
LDLTKLQKQVTNVRVLGTLAVAIMMSLAIFAPSEWSILNGSYKPDVYMGVKRTVMIGRYWHQRDKATVMRETT